jgi:hypothetical protein
VLDERAVLGFRLLEGPGALPHLFFQGRVEVGQLGLVRLRLVGLVANPIHHTIERLSQLRQFSRTRDRDSVGGVPPRQRLGALHESTERRRDPSSHPACAQDTAQCEQDAEQREAEGQAAQLRRHEVAAKSDRDGAPGLYDSLHLDRYRRFEHPGIVLP